MGANITEIQLLIIGIDFFRDLLKRSRIALVLSKCYTEPYKMTRRTRIDSLGAHGNYFDGRFSTCPQTNANEPAYSSSSISTKILMMVPFGTGLSATSSSQAQDDWPGRESRWRREEKNSAGAGPHFGLISSKRHWEKREVRLKWRRI